jgi:hypothetical protein
VQQSDHSRLAQLRAHTARPGHIYRKFSWCGSAAARAALLACIWHRHVSP